MKKINRDRKNRRGNAGLMGNGVDYTTYDMKPRDVLMAFFIGAIVGYLVMYLAAHSLKLSLAAGVVGGVLMQKPYRNSCIEKRRKELLLQFRDLMESLVASYSAGNNPQSAFEKAYDDMVNLFGEKSYMAKEVYIVNSGVKNGYTIEALLGDFADRAKLEDITSFVEIFNISYRKGGDMSKVLFDTRLVISEKIEMEQEMKVQLRGSVNELNVLIAVPVVIDFMMNGGVLGESNLGIIFSFIAVGLFVAAYAMGRGMLKKNERIM
ncbi:MAG: type II secretion system F family protein [Lachnospiraceae bacterium]|nr:type II secretion system F family protein [Lachnospiraceae bacterium]